MPAKIDPAAANGSVSDHELLARTLDAIAASDTDITAAVYARFFERCPARTDLFKVVDPTQPPHGCGQMLFEIISLLDDNAAGKPYVADYMRQTASNHLAFGVVDVGLYKEFLASLVEVLAQRLGPAWTVDRGCAWDRQSDALLSHIART